jgi:hypothetical protein
VSVHLDDGEARMTVQDLPITDFFDIPNAFFRFEDPVSEPATVSFDIHWGGPVTDVSKVNDPDVGYAGKFLLNQATMQWRARNAGGFRYVSHPSPTTSVFSQLGHMRNGIFYEA